MDVTRTIYLDDRDHSIIYYSLARTGNPWFSDPGSAGNEFMGTATLAEHAGDAANISFFGSGISILGTVSPTDYMAPAIASFTLDQFQPQLFKPHTDNQTHYNVTFYQSPTSLNNDHHTLQITLVSSGAFWLDSIVLIGDSSLAVETARPESAMNPQVSADPTVPPGPPAASSGSSAQGALAAMGVMGSVFFLVVICSLFWYIHRKRSKRPQRPFPKSCDTVVPFHGRLPSVSTVDATVGSPTTEKPCMSNAKSPRKRYSKSLPALPSPQLGSPPEYSGSAV
ncbi:hypothetical protein NP233_g850 [Leucocoprinus birnbaumii]|uniref:Uncharacterized protein n=1 Tax=Leucocoprinus birnbaumii TaxID=56174 RepID=A0AAD5W382_9AGAR|nr:hypothetical protein NP233_g850 [Leucocoprinus birnbaumii]